MLFYTSHGHTVASWWLQLPPPSPESVVMLLYEIRLVRENICRDGVCGESPLITVRTFKRFQKMTSLRSRNKASV